MNTIMRLTGVRRRLRVVMRLRRSKASVNREKTKASLNELLTTKGVKCTRVAGEKKIKGYYEIKTVKCKLKWITHYQSFELHTHGANNIWYPIL